MKDQNLAGETAIALTRAVSPTLGACQLSHRQREPVDVELAAAQHRAYEDLLAGLGCRIERVRPAPELPDAVFVEDTAVLVDEVALLTRPGAASRRAEPSPVGEMLSRWRPVRVMEAPGTLDGGDVLRVGRTVWVGRSGRTNRAGVDQLRGLLEPLGYDVRTVAVTGCLHLKSAVTAISSRTLLLNPEWVDPAEFAGYQVEVVHPSEPTAANVLRVGGSLVMPASQPRTAERLARLGLAPLVVDISELEKAEAGVTCCSIVIQNRSNAMTGDPARAGYAAA